VNRPSRTWELEISTEPVAGGIVLAAKGRIGSVSASQFEDAVGAALAAAPRIIIDMAGVDYISSAGIRALQQTAATSGGRTVLCGLHDAVRIALALSRALDGVVIAKDRQEALESLITDHSS